MEETHVLFGCPFSPASAQERMLMESREPQPVKQSDWFTRVMGEELGPMSLADLSNMARHRHLLPNDVVKNGRAGEWIPARTVKGLFDRPAEGDQKMLDLQRESSRLEAKARWMSISPYRDAQGQVRVQVALVGLDADPKDLAGSILRELRRRLDELEKKIRVEP